MPADDELLDSEPSACTKYSDGKPARLFLEAGVRRMLEKRGEAERNRIVALHESDLAVAEAAWATCPFFLWLDTGEGEINNPPACRKCPTGDGPHGGTAGCRFIAEKAARAACAALAGMITEQGGGK